MYRIVMLCKWLCQRGNVNVQLMEGSLGLID